MAEKTHHQKQETKWKKNKRAESRQEGGKK
jgi:hypothetical protein